MTTRVRLFIFFFSTLLLVYGKIQAQELRISAAQSPICVGQPFTVNYSTTQAGTLTVHIYGTSLNSDYPLPSSNTPAGDNLTATATIPNNLPTDQYRVGLTNVTANGTVYKTSGTASVVINQAATTPAVITPNPYCQYSTNVARLSAVSSGSNYMLRWYGTNATGGTYTNDAPIPATDKPGNTTYYVSQVRTDGTQCESLRASITVTVNPRPTAPATTNVTVCQNTTPVSLKSGVVASGTLNWYTTQTGGTPMGEPQLSTVNAGPQSIYYVSQTDPSTGCESERSSIQLIVKPQPSIPTVSSTPIYYCQDSPAQSLSATLTTGVSLNYYYAQTGGPASTSITPSTSLATTGQTTFYYVSQTTADGCEGPRATIVVIINRKPPMPTVVSSSTYCQGPSSVTLAASGTGLKWYDANGAFVNGTPVISTANQGPITYYVTQTDPSTGCESDRTTVTTTILAPPAPPTTAPISYCFNDPPLALTVVASGTPNWYTVASGGTSSPSITPSTSATGTTTYYVSQSVNGCESQRVSLVVTVNPLPAQPTIAVNPIFLCQSTMPTTLTASASGTLNWYTAQTGGTPSLTVSVTPTNPGPQLPYFVSQVDGNKCESARTQVNVIVNPKPAKPSVMASLSACQTTTANSITLTALGTGLKWYADANTTTSSTIAPSISTTVPGIATYYVSQTEPTYGCESDRASITATIVQTPAPPTASTIYYCQNYAQPTALTAVASAGGSLNFYTSSSGGTSSPSITPSTSATGTTTYYVSQSVNGCESQRVSLVVTVNPLPAQPTIAVNPIFLCQSTMPTTLTASASGTLNWYTVQISGTPSLTVSVTPTNPGPQLPYFVSQVDGNKCESARTQVNVIVNPKPAKPSVMASLSACQTTTANSITLTASGTGLKWYGDATSSTVIPTPIISTAAPMSSTYYVSQTDVNNCESDRASVTATIVQTPAPPTASTIYYCQNYAQPTALTAVASAGGSLNFYTSSSGGFASSSIIPSTSTTGTTPYYVSQIVNGCESNRVEVDVTIRPLPIPPTVVASTVPLCQNSSPIALSATATNPLNTLNWYLAPIGGTAYPVVYPSTTTPGLTTAYYVSQTDLNNCESARTQVSVYVKTQPTAPIVATNSLIYCQSTAPVTLTAVTSGIPNWYTMPASGTATSSVTFVPSAPSQSTYYVSQTVDNCESPRIPIVVTVQATPSVPTISKAPVYCQGSTGTISPLSATAPDGGVLLWYTEQQGGTGSTIAPTPSVGSATTVMYYVSQRVNGCESARVQLIATIQPPPTVPTVTPQVTTCQNGSAVITAALNGGTKLNWYTVPSGGSASTIAPAVDTRSAGPSYYYVSQTDANGCESNRATIVVLVNAAPSAPSLSSVSFCQGSTQTQLNIPFGGGTLNWYTTSSGGVGSTVAPIPNTAVPTTTLYFVTQKDANGCESARSTFLIAISPTPTAPVVPAIAPICQNSTPVLLTASGSSLKWYNDPTGNVVISPTVPTSVATSYNFFVSQTVNTCESARTMVTVVVNPLPVAPVVTASQSGCQDVAALPLIAAGTNLQWYDQSDNLIGPPTPLTKVDVTTIYTYRVTQTVNGCTSTKANVQYTVNVTPLPGVVTPVAICQSLGAQPLQVTSGTNLKWYDPLGNVTTTAPTPVTTATSAISSYSVTQTVNNCESRRARIDVTTTAPATARIEGNSTPIYLGSSATLSLTLTGQGPYSYTLSDGTSSVIPADVGSATTIRPISVTPTSASTTIYTITRIANACGNGTTSGTATVTVLVPTIVTAQLSNSVVCSGNTLNTFTVPFSTTGVFATDNEFTVEIGSASVNELTRQYVTASFPTNRGPGIVATIPPSAAPGQYVVRVRASNGRFPITGTPSSTTITVKAPPTATITVSSDSIYKGQSALLNFSFTGDSPWTVSYSSGSVVSAFGTNSSVYSTTVAPSAKTTYKILSVSNGCGIGTIQGKDSVSVFVKILLAADDPLSNSVKVYPVPTDGAVTVDVDLAVLKQPVQLRLIGSDGSVRQEMTTKKQQTILALDKEPAGIYLLQITVGDRSTVRRILKR